MITQLSCNVFILCFSLRLLVKCETSCVSHSHWECESVRKWEGWLSTVSPQVWMSVAGQNVIHKHTCHASYCYLNLSGYCDLLWYRLSLSPVLTYQLVAICSSWYQICCPMSVQAVLSSSDEISQEVFHQGAMSQGWRLKSSVWFAPTMTLWLYMYSWSCNLSSHWFGVQCDWWINDCLESHEL